MKKTLILNLETKNFDDLKNTLDKGAQEYVGEHHCLLCALNMGKWSCLKRSVCRAPENEIYVSLSIDESENT